MFSKSDKSQTAKSTPNPQLAVLWDTPTPTKCGTSEISSEKSLSTPVTSSFSKHSSRKHQTSTSCLQILTTAPCLPHLLNLSNIPNLPSLSQSSMKSLFNLKSYLPPCYVPSRLMAISNPTMILLLLLTPCDDPIPSSGGTHSAIRSKR